MSEIQRYDFDKAWGIEKNDDGIYVEYDDHKAIVAQLSADRSNAEHCFRELKKINEHLESQLAEANYRLAKYSNMCARLTCETYEHGTSERKAFNEGTIACAHLIDAAIASIQEGK